VADIDRLEAQHVAQERAYFLSIVSVEDGVETGNHGKTLPLIDTDNTDPDKVTERKEATPRLISVICVHQWQGFSCP
jgi:hypothetical protein